MYSKFNEEQLAGMAKYAETFAEAVNTASGSATDANANVSCKNIATWRSESCKELEKQFNRYYVSKQIEKDWGKEVSDKYNELLEDRVIYKHDESISPGIPYCCAMNSEEFLRSGTTKLGGESEAPMHLDSFCGAFVNYIYAVSSQFAGAVATPDFLLYFDYFARLDYGDDYLKTHKSEIENHLQTIIYGINHPAGNRGYQSVFWNISFFDKHYFEGMFGGDLQDDGSRINQFKFPDLDSYSKDSMRKCLRKKSLRSLGLYGKTDLSCEDLDLVEAKVRSEVARFNKLRTPNYNSIHKLQKFFMPWFRKERLKGRTLTFPVLTSAALIDTSTNTLRDRDYADWMAHELSEGSSFFIYSDKDVSSLSSCCRLRNTLDKNQFSHSMGGGGLATGSISVITINFNRLIQKKYDLEEIVNYIHKFHVSYRRVTEYYLARKMLPVYDAGFISLSRQFLTVGVNGFVQAAEYLGIRVSDNDEYKKFCIDNLGKIGELNKIAGKKYGVKFNTEFVPAEGLGVINCSKDKEDGLIVRKPHFIITLNDGTSRVVNSGDSVLVKDLNGKELAIPVENLSQEHYLL